MPYWGYSRMDIDDLPAYKCAYSLSSRATCVGCRHKIEKGLVRIAKMEYDQYSIRFGGIPRWHHVDCFVIRRWEYEFWDSAEWIPGFQALDNHDRKELKLKLPPMEPIEANESGYEEVCPAEENRDGEPPKKKIKVEECEYKEETIKGEENVDEVTPVKTEGIKIEEPNLP